MSCSHISVEAKEVLPPRLSAFCQRIKEGCQAHYGIAEGTFYRDESWLFYELGRMLERADQTTRVLDVKYHMILPDIADVGSPVDVRQWNTVLRSVSGYHAFRRVHPRGMTAATVVGFLLFNRNFPRSVMGCVTTLDRLLLELHNRHHLRAGKFAMEQCDEIIAAMTTWTVEDILSRGLHELLDWLQLRFIALSTELGHAFFGVARSAQVPPSAANILADGPDEATRPPGAALVGQT